MFSKMENSIIKGYIANFMHDRPPCTFYMYNLTIDNKVITLPKLILIILIWVQICHSNMLKTIELAF